VKYLCSEWNYPGVSAVLAEDADVLLPFVELYEMGQEEMKGAPVTVPEKPQALSWAPAEHITADDMSRDEILNGAFGA
jgi:hypothetical protein